MTQTHLCPYVSRAREVDKALKTRIDNVVDHAEVSEKSIERYLVEQAKQNGWLCLKYSNPNMVGYPDRLLVLPDGGVVWVELKSRGRKPTRMQQIRMTELAGMGHRVYVIDNKTTVDELIKTILR